MAKADQREVRNSAKASSSINTDREESSHYQKTNERVREDSEDHRDTREQRAQRADRA